MNGRVGLLDALADAERRYRAHLNHEREVQRAREVEEFNQRIRDSADRTMKLLSTVSEFRRLRLFDNKERARQWLATIEEVLEVVSSGKPQPEPRIQMQSLAEDVQQAVGAGRREWADRVADTSGVIDQYFQVAAALEPIDPAPLATASSIRQKRDSLRGGLPTTEAERELTALCGEASRHLSVLIDDEEARRFVLLVGAGGAPIDALTDAVRRWMVGRSLEKGFRISFGAPVEWSDIDEDWDSGSS